MRFRMIAVLLACGLLFSACQEDILPPSEVEEAAPHTAGSKAHQVAWEIMASANLLTLITLDESGQPQARILEALPPDSGRFDVWMGTSVRSAKVQEIRNDPRATLFYQIPGGTGYVTLRGRASIVDDPALKERYWQPHWTAFYPDPDEMYVLIHFVPDDGEVVSFAHGLEGDSLTWAAPEMSF